MKIAFLGVRVPGHLNPMTTLARKLKARGHDVVFLSMPDTERFVRAAELPFIPFCENDFPVGSLAKSMAALSKLQGQAALEMAIKSVANTMESAFRNLPRTLRDTNVDALVLDESQRGLGAVPLHLGMPLRPCLERSPLWFFREYSSMYIWLATWDDPGGIGQKSGRCAQPIANLWANNIRSGQEGRTWCLQISSISIFMESEMCLLLGTQGSRGYEVNELFLRTDNIPD
jgi:hypothetical protein